MQHLRDPVLGYAKSTNSTLQRLCFLFPQEGRCGKFMINRDLPEMNKQYNEYIIVPSNKCNVIGETIRTIVRPWATSNAYSDGQVHSSEVFVSWYAVFVCVCLCASLRF
jgi:hypothetical protein